MHRIEISHNNPAIKTLQAFADDALIVFDADFTLQDLLVFDGNDRRIQAAYIQNPTEAANVNRLERPVLISVPSKYVKNEIAAAAGNVVFNNTNFRTFLADEIADIVTNDGYKPINRQRLLKSHQGSVYRIYNNATVWIWAKALGKTGEKGRLIDVTPFIQSITVNSDSNGSNFSISLLPIIGKFDRDEFKFDRSDLTKYFHRGSAGYVSRNSVIRFDNNEVKRNHQFFHLAFSSNDVVFIQFETLEMEKTRVDNPAMFNDLFASTAVLPGKVWDMMGLIDASSTSYDGGTADVSINLQGRDMMKLLIEDGNFFFPLDFATDNGGFLNGSKEGKAMKRLVNGEFVFFNAYVDRTIEYSLRFIFNQLSNIKVCDNQLFEFFDEKVYRYDPTTDDPTQQNGQGVQANEYFGDSADYEKVLVEGVWRNIRLVIDEEIANRRIVDSSISTDSGSLLNFVRKVCQAPFVEFWGETYGDKYFFIARKPPHTGNSIRKYIEDGLIIDVLEDDIFQENLQFDDAEVFSWYRLIPKGNFFGDSDGLSFLLFPAIFFEEYAEIWGSRPLQIVSNYIDYRGFNGVEKATNLDFLEEQATQDLAFLIETNAYLPFTRTGSIVIKGDRRIKKGIFIRHKGTDEIFYVNSVTNTFSFSANGNDRVTVLQVSRGMIEKHIDESDPNNYFNIIDLKKDKNGKSTSNSFKLNPDVFNFFMKRKQFE